MKTKKMTSSIQQYKYREKIAIDSNLGYGIYQQQISRKSR